MLYREKYINVICYAGDNKKIYNNNNNVPKTTFTGMIRNISWL